MLVEILNSSKKIKPKDQKEKQQNKDILENLYNLFEGREKYHNAFDSKIFPIKTKGTGFLNFDHFRFKILTPKQMLQRLPIAFAQVLLLTVIIQKLY